MGEVPISVVYFNQQPEFTQSGLIVPAESLEQKFPHVWGVEAGYVSGNCEFIYAILLPHHSFHSVEGIQHILLPEKKQVFDSICQGNFPAFSADSSRIKQAFSAESTQHLQELLTEWYPLIQKSCKNAEFAYLKQLPGHSIIPFPCSLEASFHEMCSGVIDRMAGVDLPSPAVTYISNRYLHSRTQ